MSNEKEIPVPALDGWALILGASSGFGEAVSLKLARAGMNVIGVHLDRRSTLPNATRIKEAIAAMGREAWFFNVNAADAGKRALVLDDVKKRFEERGQGERVRVLLHSIAFGTLRPFIESEGEDGAINQKQIEMTSDVMAHSLVYWSQDVLSRQLFARHARIFAMTSTGSSAAWRGYGAVSAAKAALESHCRQLALELAPHSITANAICAGVTDTPALKKIPGSDAMKEIAARRNPSGRLTTPDDVANAIAALAQPCTYWITGNVIYADGGEASTG